MCGLSGFHRVNLGTTMRQILVWALGEGIDSRGGHASGFLCVDDNKVHAHRKLGKWGSFNSDRFVARASRGESLLQHARYATTAARTVNDAHPFTIKRDGKTVLHGMHNGIIYDADVSARKHKRPYTVDSKELFELLADGDYKAIGELHGYGVIMWVRADSPERIYICRLSEDSDFEIATVKGGGLVWASTVKILNGGVVAAGLEIEQRWEIESGIVHSIHDGEVSQHPSFKLAVAEERMYRTSASYLGSRGLTSRYDAVQGIGMRSRGSYDPHEWDDTRVANWQRFFDEERAKESATVLSADEEEEEEFRIACLEADEEEKIELCAQYGIDPKDVEDMSLDDVRDLVEDAFTRTSNKRQDRVAE